MPELRKKINFFYYLSVPAFFFICRYRYAGIIIFRFGEKNLSFLFEIGIFFLFDRYRHSDFNKKKKFFYFVSPIKKDHQIFDLFFLIKKIKKKNFYFKYFFLNNNQHSPKLKIGFNRFKPV
jgi:hypothetical protein